MEAPRSASVPKAGRATRAIVDLGAVEANVRHFRRVAPMAQLIAVVKADAYGHGAIPVAGAALRAGATGLAVYTLDEGVCLRTGGVSAPILVFGPIEPSEVHDIASYRLSPTVAASSTLKLLELAGGRATIDVHLKIDTGLTRAGASPREAVALAAAVARSPGLRLASVYTHFARADEPECGASEQQVRLLLDTVEEIEAHGVRVPLLHASNTAGALNIPSARLGAIRVGIGLYGYDPSRLRERREALTPALTLTSRLTRVSSVPPGTGVGYGHEFNAPCPSVIGLVPIGYGDGLPRQLGLGRGEVLVAGSRAPIVGRVSMDQITVDLTGIDGAEVGDEVVLIGQSGDLRQTADDLGDQAGTISYDVLTGLLPRVPRVYVVGSETVGVSRMGSYRPVPATER